MRMLFNYLFNTYIKDIIVIGSGIGGLITSLLLLRSGCNVSIYEKHDKPGGCLHTFSWKDRRQVETGFHYIGGLSKNSKLRKLFKILCPDVIWHTIEGPHDVVVRGKAERYEFGDREQQKKLLRNILGDKLSKKYMIYIERVHKHTDYAITLLLILSFIKVPNKISIWIVNSIFPLYNYSINVNAFSGLYDIGLTSYQVGILTYLWANIGLTPKEMSLSIFSCVYMHWIDGNYYPVGGPSSITNSLVSSIKNNGGKIYLRRNVQEANKKNIKVRDNIINADGVVSACGLRSLANMRNKILPSGGNSFFITYVALNGTVEQLKLPKYNIWRIAENNYMWDHDLALCKWLENGPNNCDLPIVFISFGCAKDPAFSDDNDKTFATIITPVSMNWFLSGKTKRVGHRGDIYNYNKKLVEQKLLEVFYEQFPNLKSNITFFESGTPYTFDSYIGSVNGVMYGIKKNMSNLNLYESGGTYVSGQDVISAGFIGSMIGGMICAANIKPIPCLKYLLYL